MILPSSMVFMSATFVAEVTAVAVAAARAVSDLRPFASLAWYNDPSFLPTQMGRGGGVEGDRG